ncbi:MAG: HAD family hydrolase [Chloroflexota bacterium]
MPQLKAVLFDLDDTLIDWSGFDGDYRQVEVPHFKGVRAYIEDAGHGSLLPTMDNMLMDFRDRAMAGWERGRETMISPHLPRILQEMLRGYGVPEDLLDEHMLMDHYAWDAVHGTTVFPEVPAVLETLLGADVKISIVTNAFQTMRMRDRELADHDLLRYFETCRFAAADVGYLKPHPAIFEAALSCVDVAPENAVFVGDNLNADIVGAQRIGMKAVWRDTGYHSSRVAREVIHPDATVTALDQMLPHLDTWFEGWRGA